MQYQIEKGIEIPKRGNLAREKTPFRLILDQMEIGDSVVIDRAMERQAHGIAKGAGVRITFRRQPDGTTRVWRVVDKS